MKWAAAVLNDGSFENPAFEAEFLLGTLLNKAPTELFLSKKEPVNERTAKHYRRLVERRKTHVPAAYLLGHKNFMGIDFEVNPFVLIPRPETELLVEWAVHLVQRMRNNHLNILEIGTGSGCIAGAMASRFPKTNILATDVSPEALETARLNLKRLFLDQNVRFLSSDLYRELGPDFIGVFDMIVANPPYVTRSEYESLEMDVKVHEPRRALLGGEQGFDVIHPLISGAKAYLRPGGWLLLEIGHHQGKDVEQILKSNGYTNIELRKDYAGHDRMVAAKRGN